MAEQIPLERHVCVCFTESMGTAAGDWVPHRLHMWHAEHIFEPAVRGINREPLQCMQIYMAHMACLGTCLG